MNINYQYIGWMKEGTHDKIWGSFAIDNNYYTFWGRRGKRLRFKNMGKFASYEVRELISKKERKGYEQVFGDMERIWPNFNEELEQFLSFNMLTGKVM